MLCPTNRARRSTGGFLTVASPTATARRVVVGRRRDAWATGVAKRVEHGMLGGWRHMVGRSAVGSGAISGLHAEGISLQFTGLRIVGMGYNKKRDAVRPVFCYGSLLAII